MIAVLYFAGALGAAGCIAEVWRRHGRDPVLIAFFAILPLIGLLGTAGGATAAEPRIPEASARYRLQVQRVAGDYWGLDASPARLAAQIHQESAWRPDARSRFADGLAQFTPSTAKWLPAICPEVGPPDPWSPQWSIHAAACYDAWLYRRVRPLPGAAAGVLSDCSRWAYVLRSYNGGEGWLLRERRAAAAQGRDPNDWRAIEAIRVRAECAHRENTDYPRRILLTLEPAYLRAGWPGQAVCR